jgi:transposase, IS30 family
VNGSEEAVRSRIGADPTSVCLVVVNDLDRVDPVDAERLVRGVWELVEVSAKVAFLATAQPDTVPTSADSVDVAVLGFQEPLQHLIKGCAVDFEIRNRAISQGPRKLAREWAAYLQLVKQGYSSREACRIVGINDSTGKYRRDGCNATTGRKAAPPITVSAVPPSGPSRYLTEAERIHIADRLREHASIRAIARELERAPSTISREITRNAHCASGAYRPHAAQARADARKLRPKTSKIAANAQLRTFIAAKLEKKWSPQQICQALRITFPHRPEMHVAHETIYQALYIQGHGELRREIARALRTGRTMRKPRRRPDARTPRFTTLMVMISDRPADDAADRAIPGHWEGDCATRCRTSLSGLAGWSCG